MIASNQAAWRQAKANTDCRDYARAMLGQPKRSNPRRDTYFAPHRDDGHKASFVVSHDGFKDFGGDGKSGSILDLIMLLENVTFPQAIERLQDLTNNHPINSPQRPRQERPAASAAPTANWQHAAINFIEYTQRELWKNEGVLNYLRYERLLTDEIIRSAGLGYNPRAHKVNGQYWVEAGIVIPRYQDGSLRLTNVRTVTGAFAAYLGVEDYKRFDGSDLDKYMCMSGSRLINSLYHPDELVPGRPILFVEGELDAVLAHQEIGDLVQSVTLGGATNRLTPEWKKRILALNAPIYIALDNDGAGQDATKHLIAEFGDHATAIRYPKGYKDFTDCVNAGMIARQWFESQTSPFIHADGVPASWVSVMKTYMRPGAALLFVALQNAACKGGIDPQRFTAPQLLNWMHKNGYPIAKMTFYRYLEACEGELVSKCKALSFHSEGDKDNALHFGTNPGGKPADAYQMLELSQIRRAISRQSWARLYDQEFKTDGKKGKKARPRVAGLTRLGVPNAAEIAPKLDKAYEPIYHRQKWTHIYAEKRIQEKHAAILADLADLTPLKTDGYLIKRQSDLDEPIIQARLTPGQPISLKQIAKWTGKHPTRVGQDLRRFGWESQRSECRVIPIKPGQDIRRTALNADPHARWVGLKVDDNPDLQPFEQGIANRAKSAALVIQPANTYVFVGKPEPAEQPAPVEKPARKIDMQQSDAAPEYKPAPYWGEDVNPEVDYNQVVLGLTLTGWTYEAQTGFWIDPTYQRIGRTIVEAIQLQAVITIETAPIVDSIEKQPEKREISDPPGVESLVSLETPEIAEFFIKPEKWFGDLEF